jgi:hypothetical protein
MIVDKKPVVSNRKNADIVAELRRKNFLGSQRPGVPMKTRVMCVPVGVRWTE